MEVVDIEEFAQTIYQMKKEIRKRDEEIEILKKEIEKLQEIVDRLS